MIRRHPESLPQGFQHSNRVVGTNCTGLGLIRRGASEYAAKRIGQAVQKHAETELRHHQQSCLALTSVVSSATDSLELELV